ncbi:hypothetical protein RISK_000763 [Rhodopirellula islandica]|uniref:NTP pyrophosphohydrolase MazG-like domain-containing protein n=1 Tax=Rhodopirellula islandica TaxID=595434 RepID=A0A0J1BKC6_RHOIS|nr:nucleotide pyrophosphohydrolase [Rhodopirellula islandica]KLU06962.1 hypothetical protein RISK_000763 [Rhodopirellula islandica]
MTQSSTDPVESPSPAITIADAQEQVDQWIQTIGVRYFDEMTNLAQLVEEVGEVARILSRTKGEQSTKSGVVLGELSDELADVMFVVICLANQSGIDLTDALRRNLEKKTKRDESRHRNNAKLVGDGEAARSKSPESK